MTHALHGLHVSSIRDPMALPDAPPGWLSFTEIAGRDGGDYSRYELLGYGIIVRLNHSYGAGTIPAPPYDAFAVRCADFVANSRGCRIWIISNEPNHSQERPHGAIITPDDYTSCFWRCYDAIKRVQPDSTVLAAPVAPYNDESGDFLVYLDRVAATLTADGIVDGWCLHAYTHGHDPALVSNELRVNGWHWHLRTYRDQLAVLARHRQDVPVYLTEYNPIPGWTDADNGYVAAVLREIDEWNRDHVHQVIRAACAFRWHDPSRDEWTIRNKPGVVSDYIASANVGYAWDSWDTGNDEPPDEEEPVNGFVNGSYEDPFPAIAGHDNIQIAHGWNVWWSMVKWPDQDQNPDRPIAAPEGKPVYASQFAYRVIDGAAAQCLFVYSKLMNCGVYQRVQVGAGRRVTFSQPFQAWCSNSNDPRKSDAELYMRVGIDVRGGTDWRADSIVWGNWVRGTADYASTGISAISETDEVTVFVHAWNKWAMTHNDLYLDGATLAIEGENDDGEPEPQPPTDGVLRVEVTGPGGGPVLVQQVGGAGLLARIRALLG